MTEWRNHGRTWQIQYSPPFSKWGYNDQVTILMICVFVFSWYCSNVKWPKIWQLWFVQLTFQHDKTRNPRKAVSHLLGGHVSMTKSLEHEMKVKVWRSRCKQRSIYQGFKVVAIIVHKIRRFNVKSDKVTGVWNIGQGHRVKVRAKSRCRADASCKVWWL